MKTASLTPAAPLYFSNLPDGAETIVIAELLKQSPFILHIARDDGRMMRMAEHLRFLAPNAAVHTLPAWDCLPYDRVSPHAFVVSQRLETLCSLTAWQPGQPCVVVATVNALLQRVPPRTMLHKQAMVVKVGDNLPHDQMVAFLIENGYNRSPTATDPGEFALRGSIIDIIPTGQEDGFRLDFFGTTLESIRSFDPLTQISGNKIEKLRLLPASELLLNEDSIRRFRLQYRTMFGAVTSGDILYETISEGRKYAGMEHWLPLFYESLDTVFDYLPANALLSFDHLADEARAERETIIADYYAARKDAPQVKGAGEMPYHPVTPESLYIPENEWQQSIRAFPSVHLSQFAAPAEVQNVTLGYSAVPNFHALSKTESTPALTLMQHYIADRKLEALKQKASLKIVVTCFSEGSRERLRGMLQEQDIHVFRMDEWGQLSQVSGKTVGIAVLPLEHGFATDQYILISEQDILGDRIIRATRKQRRAEDFLNEAASLNVGELVVHKEHGIGQFQGLETLIVSGEAHDFLLLVYDGGDKFYVPVENSELITRYGAEEGVKLDKLGGLGWQSRKAKLKKRIKLAAEALLKIAAERAMREGTVFQPLKGMYQEFCNRFPYAETDDQLRAIEDVENDLASGKPMDRLICGDVGFGKTEVALRAAFIVAAPGEDGTRAQVAVITPTTLLARQHYQRFKERFAGLPVRIRQLSRMVTAKEANETKNLLAAGEVDIVIGTHALLAKNIDFANLGLLIVDEEQHFGVAQKERIKQLRANIHVLTLSATPIPRTLQMSLVGIRDLSLIATPPVDRLAVRTFVMPFDPVVIREAILREHYRGGRSFYVCPRIQDLEKVHDKLRTLVPEVKIVIGHGQMPPGELDDVMNAFYDGKYDVLLSTTIIESGLDIPTANTMIIHRADMFGLAQLYQIRGRVGRSKIRAYAYLTLEPRKMPTPTAMRRLEVMQSLDTLGAGFSLASHDMDIRGVGNLLGDEQSGHIKEVGVELYQHMLKETVEAIKQQGELVTEEEIQETWSPQINLGLAVLIPEAYIPDLTVRMGLYRRISQLKDQSEIEGFAAELIDRFGPIPPESENLLQIVKLKQLCRQAGIAKVESGPKGVVIGFYQDQCAYAEKLLPYITKRSKELKLRGDQKLVWMKEWATANDRVKDVTAFLQLLGEFAAN